ncbi:hypothetical protein OAT84_00220 [Gammaproteobacteria bacterium]|nr:hypothetical protein [Gammaproteobacteria bacterium]
MKKGITSLALCLSFVSAQSESTIIDIDLAIKNSTKNPIDIVIEHKPAEGTEFYQGRGFSLSSWPVVNLEPKSTSYSKSFSEVVEGSTMTIYAFESSSLDPDQLLLSSMVHTQMKHLGSVVCRVENGGLSCDADSETELIQSGSDGSVSLSIFYE